MSKSTFINLAGGRIEVDDSEELINHVCEDDLGKVILFFDYVKSLNDAWLAEKKEMEDENV